MRDRLREFDAIYWCIFIMTNQAEFEFVQMLGKDVETGNISLPSLPAVVLKIRNMLEEESCDFEKISKIVSVDTALVSKLFVFANSAYHNRSGETIANLEVAIGNLGLDLVRSTAVALVIQQLVCAQEQSHIKRAVREIWSRSVCLSSMSHAVAGQFAELNDETAFMCGLLHDVGKLYSLSKVKDVSGPLDDESSLLHVLNDWSPQIGKCIVEAWGFPTEVVESVAPGEFLVAHGQESPKMVDVVYVAGMILDNKNGDLTEVFALPASQRIGVNENSISAVRAAYKDKLTIVQHSFA